MNILIVEDLPDYQDIITRYLARILSDHFHVRISNSIQEALVAIQEEVPDLLLLDINLPDGNGFDLLNKIGREQANFKLIFISAYDQYAIKAFKFSAIDYVLKPIDFIDFENAIHKAIASSHEEEQLKRTALSENLQPSSQTLQHLILKDANAIYLIETQHIIRCEAANNYTTFFLNNGQQYVVSTTLKEYYELLKDQHFFRPHQSHLINLRFFMRYDKRDGGYIVLKDDTIIPLSRGKKERLLTALAQL